ncbi:MAG TPA: hypothetical protein VFU19_00495 [Iamia sp.]|nr:hypothetical protein [Iamia sp.]
MTIDPTPRATEWLRDHALPHSDRVEMTESVGEFPNGGRYGVEIPAINTLSMLETMIDLLTENGVYCTRFNETHGSFLLSDLELGEMFDLCAQRGYGYVIGLGPRPEYDIKASFYRTKFGLEVGRQVNNNDAIAVAVEETFRLVELGCRGILVYDMGLCRVVHQMRAAGAIPADVRIKTSSHCSLTNAMLGQIMQENGADTVTTMHDLAMESLYEIRRLSPGLVLDIPTDTYRSKGGYIRFYELAQMVQLCSPVFLKMGGSVQEDPNDTAGEGLARRKVDRVGVGLEYLEKHLPPDVARIDPSDPMACIPQPAGSTPALAEPVLATTPA